MPLDARKIAHITAKQALLFLQRAQTINLTLKNTDGSTTLLQVQGIFRLQQDLDPSEVRITNTAEIHNCDAIMMVREQDVSFTQLRACIYVELASPAGADTIASRYILTSITPKGLMPGGDRWLITLDRQKA